MSVYGVCKGLFGGLFRLIYRVRVIGRENEPKDRACLVCANHASYIDPVLLAAVLRRKQRFLAKKSLSRHWYLRLLFRAFGVLTVSEGDNNLLTFRQAIRTLRAGEDVALFPQGKRIPYTDPLPEQAMGGMLVIAAGAKADVLPVSILTACRKPKPFRKTTVRIGRPIPYAEWSAYANENGREQAARACFARVCEPFREAAV